MSMTSKKIIQYLTVLDLLDETEITADMVKAQYRKLSTVYHPDTAPNVYKDGAKFHLLTEARAEVLENLSQVNAYLTENTETGNGDVINAEQGYEQEMQMNYPVEWQEAAQDTSESEPAEEIRRERRGPKTGQQKAQSEEAARQLKKKIDRFSDTCEMVKENRRTAKEEYETLLYQLERVNAAIMASGFSQELIDKLMLDVGNKARNAMLYMHSRFHLDEECLTMVDALIEEYPYKSFPEMYRQLRRDKERFMDDDYEPVVESKKKKSGDKYTTGEILTIIFLSLADIAGAIVLFMMVTNRISF